MKTYRGRVAPSNIGDPYMARVTQIIMDHPKRISTLAADGGVGDGTIRNWISGKTKRPCRATVAAVLKECGVAMILVPANERPLSEIRPIKRYVWKINNGERR